MCNSVLSKNVGGGAYVLELNIFQEPSVTSCLFKVKIGYRRYNPQDVKIGWMSWVSSWRPVERLLNDDRPIQLLCL